MQTFKAIGEWVVLLPLWRQWIKPRGGQIAAAMGTGFVWLVILSAIVSAAGGGGSEDKTSANPTATAAGIAANLSDSATPTSKPTKTPAPTPTPTPEPTPTPKPTPSPTLPPPPPVDLQGFGQTATDTVTPPASISKVSLTYSGSGNFIVWAYQGGSEDLLVNTIGSYSGTRVLFGEDPVFFDITADGPWTLHMEAPGFTTEVAFSGTGDSTSDLIVADNPDAGPWNISHDGSANFIVWLHCASGSDLVENEIGPVSGSTVVDFGSDPCLWEVEADGNWSLSPR